MTTTITHSPQAKHPLSSVTPLNRALNVVGTKWALPIVAQLLENDQPTRFVTIQRQLKTVSTEQLRTTLNRLVRDGVLSRTRYREVPPRVDYALTEHGLALKPVIEALQEWGA
jgi:DNA-binding HxlR family transcriptional regulator